MALAADGTIALKRFAQRRSVDNRQNKAISIENSEMRRRARLIAWASVPS